MAAPAIVPILKKVASVVLSDKKGRKAVLMIVGIVLVLLLLPIIALLGIFSGGIDLGLNDINSMVQEQQQVGEATLVAIEEAMLDEGYDKTGIEKHLEQMASEGWLLEKMSAFRWNYRRIEPKKIHFSVSYYATITDFEPEPTEEQQAFNEFCEHSGWKLAASTMQMQVFYNENENPVPIETDPALEVENIHRSVKKTVLVSYFLMMFFGLLLGASFVDTLISDPVYLLASSTKLFTGIWCVIAFAYSESSGRQ